MNKIQIILAGFGALLVLGSLTLTVGSGQVVTETRAISDISTVELRGRGEIIVNQGDEESLTIEAEDNVMSLIDTRVSGKTLTLDFNTGWIRTVIPRRGIKYYLTLSNPREFIISGSGSLDATDISVDSFMLQVNGSGKAYVSNLTADRLESGVNGSGELVLNGDVREQRIEISGSANYTAVNLVSDIADVKISGSGKTELNVQSELNVRISGSGEVFYRGNPRVNKNVSGSGEVRNVD